MVRKGSYTVSDGVDSPAPPPANNARAVEIDYGKAVQDDRRTRNQERNLRMLVVALILVVVLLLGAIIWLLLTYRSKPHTEHVHTTTHAFDEAQGRHGGQAPTSPISPKSDEVLTSSTTRRISVIDPGKKKTTTTTESPTSATDTTSTPLGNSTSHQHEAGTETTSGRVTSSETSTRNISVADSEVTSSSTPSRVSQDDSELKPTATTPSSTVKDFVTPSTSQTELLSTSSQTSTTVEISPSSTPTTPIASSKPFTSPSSTFSTSTVQGNPDDEYYVDNPDQMNTTSISTIQETISSSTPTTPIASSKPFTSPSSTSSTSTVQDNPDDEYYVDILDQMHTTSNSTSKETISSSTRTTPIASSKPFTSPSSTSSTSTVQGNDDDEYYVDNPDTMNTTSNSTSKESISSSNPNTPIASTEALTTLSSTSSTVQVDTESMDYTDESQQMDTTSNFASKEIIPSSTATDSTNPSSTSTMSTTPETEVDLYAHYDEHILEETAGLTEKASTATSITSSTLIANNVTDSEGVSEKSDNHTTTVTEGMHTAGNHSESPTADPPSTTSDAVTSKHVIILDEDYADSFSTDNLTTLESDMHYARKAVTQASASNSSSEEAAPYSSTEDTTTVDSSRASSTTTYFNNSRHDGSTETTSSNSTDEGEGSTEWIDMANDASLGSTTSHTHLLNIRRETSETPTPVGSEGTEVSEFEITTEAYSSTVTENLLSTILPDPEPTVCLTKKCKKMAARMLMWMDHQDGNSTDIASCNTFYHYACGGLLSSEGKIQPLEPEEEASRRIAETLSKITNDSPRPLTLFQRFYNNCLNFDADMNLDQRFKEASQIVSEVGKFYTTEDWNSSADATELIAKLIIRHSTPLFDVMLDVSKADPSKFALRVTIPFHSSLLGHDNELFSAHSRCLTDPSKTSDVTMNLGQTYDNYVACKKNHLVHLESLEEAVQKLQLLNHLELFNQSQTLTAVRQDVEMNILYSIDEYKPSADKIRKTVLDKDFEEIPLRNMDERFPGVISWPQLFEILLNKVLPDDEPIQVYFPEYFAKMLKSIGTGLQLKKGFRQLHNALLAMYATEVYQEMVIPPYYFMRDVHCLRATSTVMEDIASYMYLKSYTPQELDTKENQLMTIFDDIKTTLVEELQSHRETWNDTALQALVNKTRQMQASLNSGRNVMSNMTHLETKYVDIPDGLNYIKQSATLVQKYRKSMYGLYGKTAVNEEVTWSHFLLPHSNYGITIYGQNRIVLPFGALHPRFYDHDLPYYLNLARLGALIGHEMVHAFDSIGIQYGSSKSLWKSTPASASYNSSLHCLLAQPDSAEEMRTLPYSHGGEKLVSFRHNSNLTLNERFADLSGTYLAWKTHQRLTKSDSKSNEVLPWMGMSQDKLFFLANAQMQCSPAPLYQHSITLAEKEHLPPELRVETIANNLEAFSDAFHCVSSIPDKCPPFPAFPPFSSIPL